MQTVSGETRKLLIRLSDAPEVAAVVAKYEENEAKVRALDAADADYARKTAIYKD